ncbi:MAG: helix-turn-helix domain-containing protein [Bacteroidales bacterium]|nr:helix-turn-helix domain-containing protein [Bacteroidales bacterium]
MSSNTNKRLHAERLYIEEGWSQKDIATTVGVSENTVTNWVKKYDWKIRKAEIAAAPHKVRQKLMSELQKVLDGEVTGLNADVVSKITRAIERLDKGVSVQVTISVMKMFTDFITTQEIDSETLSQIVELSKLFIKEQIDKEQ